MSSHLPPKIRKKSKKKKTFHLSNLLETFLITESEKIASRPMKPWHLDRETRNQKSHQRSKIAKGIWIQVKSIIARLTKVNSKAKNKLKHLKS